MMIKEIKKKVKVKIIIFGEHVVLYGFPALSKAFGEFNLTLSFFSQVQKENQYLTNLRKLAKTNLYCDITSDIPIAKGFGSSAVIAYHYFRALGLDNPLQLAKESENLVHGRASGIDLAQVSSEKMLVFQNGKKIKELTNNKQDYLLIVDSGEEASTKDMVEKVRDIYNFNPNVVNQLGYSSTKGIQSYSKHKNKYHYYINQSQYYLKKLGLSTKIIDKIIYQAKKYGARSAKLSGSGGGGCVLLLFKNHRKMINYRRKLEKAGFKSWVEKI